MKIKYWFKLLLISFTLLTIFPLKAREIKQNLKQITEDGVEAWYLADEKTPLFSMALYLGDGAFADPEGLSGVSGASLDLAFEGTDKYSEEDISRFFDKFGASYTSDIKHEYSSFYLSGLLSDMEPLIEMVCHIFNNASYPVVKLNSFKSRMSAELGNMKTSPEGIAQRVSRAETLKAHKKLMLPSDGLKKDLLALNPDVLKKQLHYLVHSTKRKLYINGPKEVMKLPRMMQEKCSWEKNPDFLRTKVNKKITGVKKRREILLVPVENSNQAQIRIGKLIDGPVNDQDLSSLALLKGYLAGAGFISELFTELRVKRGLTYTVSAYADMQFAYGRSGISTFTQNKRITEMLNTIKDIFNNLGEGKFNKDRLALVRKNLQGGYLFGFEKNESLLENIMYLHHINRDEQTLYGFPDNIAKVSVNDLKDVMNKEFSWNEMTIVIVGDKSLERELKKIAPVRVIDWKDYL